MECLVEDNLILNEVLKINKIDNDFDSDYDEFIIKQLIVLKLIETKRIKLNEKIKLSTFNQALKLLLGKESEISEEVAED